MAFREVRVFEALLRWRIGRRIEEREAVKHREPSGSQSFVGSGSRPT